MQKSFLFSRSLLLFFFAAISCVNKPKDQDCAKLRSGEFFMKASGNTPSFSIRRTDSLQYEKDNVTGAVRIYSVKWISPCEYNLKLLHKPSDSATLNQSALRDSLEKITSTVTFLEVKPKYYIFEIKKEGISMAYKDTMWVMK